MTAQACAAEEKMIHPVKSTLLTEEELAAIRYVLTEEQKAKIRDVHDVLEEAEERELTREEMDRIRHILRHILRDLYLSQSPEQRAVLRDKARAEGLSEEFNEISILDS
jgi:hypothetical protein